MSEEYFDFEVGQRVANVLQPLKDCKIPFAFACQWGEVIEKDVNRENPYFIEPINESHEGEWHCGKCFEPVR